MAPSVPSAQVEPADLVGRASEWEVLAGMWNTPKPDLVIVLGKRRVLLVLDEFPYLSDAAPALASIVQGLWDHAWAKTRLKIILSGSHITAMTRLEAADQPLYGRRTRGLVLAPFGPKEVGAFVPHYTPRQRLTMYGVVGGLPGAPESPRPRTEHR